MTLLPTAEWRDREHTTAADGLENNQYSAFFKFLVNNENFGKGQYWWENLSHKQARIPVPDGFGCGSQTDSR